MKLTDTQLVLLSAASQRDDRGVILPENLKGAAARKVVGRLLEAGLIEEVRKTGDLVEWRRDEGGEPAALVITTDGLKDIGIEAAPAEDEANPTETSRQSRPRAVRKPRASRLASAGTAVGAGTGKTTQPRTSHKTDRLVSLLKRSKGAGIDEIVEALGWLPHTTRAAITGLRKRGFAIERQKSREGRAIYRITGDPLPATAGGAKGRRKGSGSGKRDQAK